ncbi:hypothetical protein DERP_013772 [Dermatophagoides pteronyssinus]|uniref:Perilipin-2-like n=1 Tax=Dermatophagoides pteronyssinus TaxID=6956 RepID=A0ABQ8JFX3_DERPT|nr:hypothetical protein DERP_013772 [Dermatophagoides pteronyssinus]
MSSTNQSVVKSSPSSMIHLDIMDRLRQIQLIQQALEMAESSYSRIKQSNPMFDATLTQAESMANQLAMPVINKLEQPIQLVDNLACQSFDTIQSGVSMISKNQVFDMVQKRMDDTMEFVQSNTKQARTMFEQRLEQTLQRAYALRKQASEHVNSVMNVSETVIKSVDKSLNAAENALDRLLPPLKPETETNEQQQQPNGQQPVRRLFQRMVRFSDKLRRRIVQYTLEKWYTNAEKSGLHFRENVLNLISSQLSNLRLQMNNLQTEEKPKQS